MKTENTSGVKTSKKSKRWKILIISGIVFLGLFVALSFGLAVYVMKGKRQTLAQAMKWQSEHYDTSFYEPLEKTDYTVTSFDGYELNVQLLKNPVPTDKYVIISHGHTDNRLGALKYVKMYLDLGFNCIIYDLRGHGLNEPTFTSYGIREGRDIAELVKDTRSRYPVISQLGLHGESLGAASSAASLKYKPEVDFVVADCGFADIDNVLRGAVKKAHMPSFLVDLANFGATVLYHHSFGSMRPIDSLDENTVPMLFIHGSEDDFIPPENSQRMSKRTKGYSEVRLIEGASHAFSMLTDPVTYKRYVEDFLDKVNKH